MKFSAAAFLKMAQERGATLVVTLLVLTLLSTIVVAFIQTVSMERGASRSIKTRYQAQLAAQAGLQAAASEITSFMQSYPYHGVGYATSGNQTLTILTGLGNYNDTGTPTRRFLISGNNSSAPPPALDANNSTIINFTNTLYPGGWVGSSINATTGNFTYRECRAPWVYILQNSTLAHQPNPSAANYNPHIARYAFWVEDETSKIDLMAAGNTNGASGGYIQGTNAIIPSDVDIGAAPLVAGRPLATNAASTNQAILAFRNNLTNLPPIQGALAYLPAIGTNGVERSRFYTTYASFANNLAGTGQRRININALVSDGANAQTPPSQGDITGDLQDIIYAITGSQTPTLGTGSGRVFNNLPNTNSPFPNFGNRFFAASTPDASQRDIYLKKIAANIRDYIDNDSQPTFINSAGTVAPSSRPTDSWQTGQWPQAIGKEAAPFYTEHAMVGIEKAWTSGNPARGTLKIDHYIEFSNPSTKDYTAPAGSFVKLTNLMSWKAGTQPWIEPDDFEMDISGITFPAGSAIVITTNMNPADDPPGLISNTANLFRRPTNPTTNTTQFADRLTDESISGTRGFQADSRDSTVSDCQARLVFGNGNGTVFGLPAIGFTPAGATTPFNFRGLNLNNLTRFVYSTGLRGNMPESSASDSRSGDPRSVAEQLSFQIFNNDTATGAGENTRFYGAIQGTGVIPGQSTLGRISTSFVNPERLTGIGRWPDYTQQFNETSGTAYAVISDQPMTSIGELGHIYDPGQRRVTTTIEAARGGGRTLKIGQPDDSIGTAARFSTTWQNAAWRLTDIFGTNATRTTVELDPVSRGKININSVARDGGTALRALLRSWTFLPSPESDQNTAARQLSSSEIDSIMSSIVTYINSNGPLLERGEISQIPYFSSTSTSTIGGQQVRTTADRSREQIIRRMIEMVTTRSASFSVFCIGESIQESPTGVIRTLSQETAAANFRIDPIIDPAIRSRATGYRATQLYEIQ
jgi:hypothetical protein